MKLLIWTVYPNHYQSAFFHAIRQEGIDLRVCYYQEVEPARQQLGWPARPDLPAGEHYVPESPAALDAVSDWSERIHILPGGYATPFLRQLLARILAAGAPWIHWSEPSRPSTIFFWPKLQVKRLYAHLVNRKALGAFGIGAQAMAEFARWGIAPERIALLPYSAAPVDRTGAPDDVCASFGASGLKFLFLGSLCPRKGVDVLLRAFARAGKRYDGSFLMLVGNDASNGGYSRAAQRLAIGDRVLFRGPVSAERLGGILQTADVLVLPSRSDGWGVVLNEAASAGLALIGSDKVGAADHLIHPGENGFRVKAGRVESLASALAAYMEAPELARRHGKRSLAIFPHYTPERNVERLLRAVETWKCLRRSDRRLPEPRSKAA